MPLPPQAIREFQQIWREEYGEELAFEKARLVAERFLSGVHQMLVIKTSRVGSDAPDVK